MKIFRNRKTAKTNFTGRKTTKMRFFILASIVLVAISSTVAFSSITTAGSLGELLSGKVSLGNMLFNASVQDDSKKDDKSSRLLQLAPDSLVSELATARSGHTATRLDGEKVLITGGDANGTAEIFDAATGTSSATGNLNAARSGHTATKLADGRVLVTGGTSSGAAVASTEIYNTSTGTFSTGATMNAARSGHTATVLANGKILIAGGDLVGSAEIYDPAADTFTAVSTMTISRAGHSAALMKDNRVLLVGGSDAQGNELHSAEIFDSAASIFSATGNEMAHHRTNALLRVLPDGKVQIIGGNNDLSMEVYDPTIDTIGAHAHLIPTGDEHDALLQSDLLSSPSRSAMFHNGQTDALFDRSNFTVTELGNQALVAGGANTSGTVLSSLTVLNSSNATVTTDKLDYQPGQTAVISGTGWQAGETVNIILHEDPHTHTERRLTTTADENGDFTANYLVEAHDFGVTFIAGAKGVSSGRTAQTTFTDALILSATITPTTASTSSTVNYSITITNNSNAAEVLGSGRIQIPVGYTAVSSITYTTSPSGKTWNPRVGTGSNSDKILYDANAAGDTLAPTNSITITFNATAPSTTGSREWTTLAFTGRNFSTGPYPAPASQPTVIVNSACTSPGITTPPSGLSKTVSESATFSVVATGTAPLNYQWRKNGSNISLATSDSYTIPSVLTGDAGNYDVVVSNNCGSVTTPVPAAVLTVNKATPTITWNNPADITYGTALGATQLNATASVGGSFAYTPTSGTILNAGNAQTLHVDFTPTDTANYKNASKDVSINVLQKTLTPNITASNKVYDGNTSATVLTRTFGAGEVVGSDVVTLTGGTATFDTKNVGTGKTVTATGLSLSGTTAGNYVLSSTSAATTADITALAITGSITAGSKIYNGTTAAAILTRTLTGVIAPDTVHYTGGTADFNNKNVGTGKTVTATGLSLSGADSGNYTVNSTATTTADITARPLVVTATGVNKIYDGTTSATVTFTDDRISGDVLTIGYTTAMFTDKNVGSGKTVSVSGISLSGTDSGNYSANSSATATADITPRTLNVTATGVNKVYDGTTAATVNLNGDGISGDEVTLSYSAAFANKNAGTGKPVSVSGIIISGGADGGNYVLGNTTASTTADITPKGLTVTASAQSKEYDGNANASVTLSIQAGGVIGTDAVGTSFTTALFNDKNVGVGKTVTVSGIALTDADAGNYSANATATATADITAKTLTASVTVNSKIYDGTTAAVISGSSLMGVISGDTVNLTGGSATFSDKNVGIGKIVNISGLTLSGTDAGNYSVSATATTTADISARALTVSATGENKVYDGNSNATVTLSNDKVSGDDITTSYTGASFDTKNVGTAKPVSVSGISITGVDAANYTFNTTANTTADITVRPLTVSAAGVNKVYDGNASATVTLSSDQVSGDSLTLGYTTASFANKSVGMAKNVSVTGISVSGTDSGNYALGTTTASATADIAALAITGSITVNNKIYDGNTTATIASYSLTGQISGDVVSYTGGTANFDTKGAGTGKAVTATGLSLTGTDAGNYTVNDTATTTADITARTLTVSAAGVNKIYDGTANANVNLFDNRVSGDDVIVGYTTATFADKNVGNGKSVSVNGISITGGADANNYAANTSTTTTADIMPRTLIVAANGVNKQYDGSTTATITFLSDKLPLDDITLSYTSASFADKTVGINKPISVSGISISGGAEGGNYVLASTTANATADITAKTLTGSITAANKTYDGNTSATILTRSLSGVISGDTVNYVNGTAVFDIKDAGTSRPVTASGLSLSGADAGNYTVNTTASTTADINALSIVGSITAGNKVYDGNTTAAILTRTLSGQISGDNVSYVGGTANFSNKNVANGKTVNATGLSLSGADAGNYTVNSSAATTADITPRTLTVSATGINKVYDGTANAVVTLSDDKVSSDEIITNYTSAMFADKNIGIGKNVNVSGISISGADAGNYTFNTTAATTADITARTLTVSAAGVNKVYDANTNAAVTLSDDRVSGDIFTASYTSASFTDKIVGTAKSVSVSGISVSGTDAGNYTFNTTASTTADITKLAITGSITANNKVYDGGTAATIATRTLSGVIIGDVVNYIGGTATFDNKNVGTGKTVTATGLSLSGTDAGNYTVNTTATTTADITKRTLTVTATAQNKVFDGNANAMVTLSDNRVTSDVLTASFVSATFDNANIGTGKTVTVNGISISGTDAGNYMLASTTATTTANITAAGTSTSVSVNPSSVQYSDTVAFTANIVATNASLNSQLSGTVQFKINGTAFGSPASISGGTASLTFNNQLAPGGYNVSAVFTSTNSNLSGSTSGNAALTITREDARIFYTGMTFVNTSCATCGTATVQLSATVKDITAVIGDPAFDGNPGNISNATLTFVNKDTNTDIATVPISLVSAGDTKVGTAVYNWNVNIGSSESDIISIGFRVNGYYTRYDPNDDEVITISKPIGTNFITGGGHIINSASTGMYAGGAGLKTNFGFNVKYNKSGKSLQGSVNVIVRAANGKVYQIKGNQMDTLTADTAKGTSYYTGKANLTDITDPLGTISLGGGHSFQMKLTDKGEPGSTDTIGITLYGNNTGALLFSSNWNGTTTIEQLLRGGNLVVR